MGGDPLSPIPVVPGRSLEERQLQKEALLWEPWGNTHSYSPSSRQGKRKRIEKLPQESEWLCVLPRGSVSERSSGPCFSLREAGSLFLEAGQWSEG